MTQAGPYIRMTLDISLIGMRGILGRWNVPQPLYLRIAKDLEEQIQSGSLAEGSRLPTEAELKEQYGPSRNTVGDAIQRLTGNGLIETRPGKGTFVTSRRDPFVTVLTGNPRVGVSVGEGATYLSEVN